MRVARHRITIIRINKPEQNDLNEELQWFGTSLGLFNLRDKDRSCFRLFIELLKAAKRGTPLSSDDLAAKLQLSRGTIVHHIHKLMSAGIVKHNPTGYILRAESLHELVQKLKSDVNNYFSTLSEVAKELDTVLDL